jgi:hypothetical protein
MERNSFAPLRLRVKKLPFIRSIPSSTVAPSVPYSNLLSSYGRLPCHTPQTGQREKGGDSAVDPHARQLILVVKGHNGDTAEPALSLPK